MKVYKLGRAAEFIVPLAFAFMWGAFLLLTDF